jgi:transcriptional regulator with XRE-family HTH domain
VPRAQDATVQRRRLRGELRRVRNERGYTQRDVAEAMDWSVSKMTRIESGTVTISRNDLVMLLQHYGIVDADEVDRFHKLARASKESEAPWWTAYRGVVPPQYLNFLRYESSASVIQLFQPLLMPGLLQEEEYARAVLRAYGGSASAERVEELVELRMRQQLELLEREDPPPPEMNFVMDEAALHRWVGGRGVMRRQLQRLKQEASRDNVTIEVVPFSAGEHPGMRGPFLILILQFEDDRDEHVLFLENSRGDMLVRDEPDEIKSYTEAFAQLQELARKEDLETLIDKALKELF